jgi:hypothetical protein
MNEYYNRKQVMELLGFTSTNAFLQLARKYPDVFMNVNQGANKDKYHWYDKATVDKFARTQGYLKQEKL